MSSIVQSLPHDIVREIFAYLSTPLLIHEWHAFPWFLGHISSEWRYVFVSMIPEFWSNISLDWRDFGTGGRMYKARQILARQLVELFLERGSGRPFSFQYRLPPRCHSLYVAPQWEFACRIFDLLVQESTRWAEASIKADITAVGALHLLQNRIPLLRRLELHVTGTVDESLTGAFANAPSLTSIVVSDVSTWKFNWSSLTIFRLDFCINFKDFLSVISQMGRLEHLTVCKDYALGPHTPSPHRVALPRLKFLATCGTGLFPYIEAPTLEELSIFFQPPDRIDPFYSSHNTQDPSFLRNSCRTLLRLNVYGCTRRTLVEIMPYTPNIIHLGLDCLPDLSDALGCLADNNTQNAERPVVRLESLRISCYYNTMTIGDVKAIRAFVTSQGKKFEAGGDSKRLRSLQIKYLSNMKTRGRIILEEVKVLCGEAGIHFERD